MYALILFHRSNHAGTPVDEGVTRRWLDYIATLSREDSVIFLCSLPSTSCSLHQLTSTRYAAHSTWCQAGSPRWFTRLLSHTHTEQTYISNRGKQAGDWRAHRPILNKTPSLYSRSVFVLTWQWQCTKKAAKDWNYAEMAGSGFWQICGCNHTHWHTSLTQNREWTSGLCNGSKCVACCGNRAQH